MRFSSQLNMIRRRRVLYIAQGLIIGFFAGLFISRFRSPNVGTDAMKCRAKVSSASVPPVVSIDPLKLIGLSQNETRHNSNRTLVFVGVMTAQKYLQTRAVAVYDTWGKELPGRIAFFSSESSVPPRPDFPLVSLKGVDDSYPPQKKSFMMLRYMWEHFGDKFEWFMRADDDVYVRSDKLENFLRSVNSEKARFVGQAGRGNRAEFGLLNLEEDENFCMGGPGVFLSRETLARVAPHVKECLANMYTTHEDVELGRCVRRFAGISCTWSYEMQTILYHNSSGSEAFTSSLKQKEVHQAITLHPVKHHDVMYRIHNYMKGLKIQDLQHKAVVARRDIATAEHFLHPEKQRKQEEETCEDILSKPPRLNRYRTRRVEDVIVWDFISRSQYSATNMNPRRRIDSALKEALNDVVREVMNNINQYSKQRGRVIEFREILYGYYRVNPLYGVDYILDLLLVYKKYRGRKMTVPVRRHVYLQQQFTGVEIREVFDGVEVNDTSMTDTKDSFIDGSYFQIPETVKEVLQNGLYKLGESLPFMNSADDSDKISGVPNKRINFILPLSGRLSAFKRFLSVFEAECLQRKENVSLIIVLYPSETENTFNQSLVLVQNLQKSYPDYYITCVPRYETFSRAIALAIGASRCDSGELLFFIDVDIVFLSPALTRIRMNTIQSKQVYFPIVYSEFDPRMVFLNQNVTVSPNHFLINRDTGYWRQFGYGIVSIYKSDFVKVGGFNTSIKGWGKEDIDLFEKVIVLKNNLTAFRAVDPALVHVFHVINCDPKLEEVQLRMCQGSRADTLGSVHQLAKYINQHKEIFEYLKSRRTGGAA